METMGRKKARPRRSFSKGFKAEVVDLVRTSGKSVPEVCRDLDLTETAVRSWVRQAESTTASGRASPPLSGRSWPDCARRTGCCAKSVTS